MQSQTAEIGKVQMPTTSKPARVGVFRHQKWIDGDGKLWIVLLTFGHDNKGLFGNMVELLDVDGERTVDMPRAALEEMVRDGVLKRVEGAILI